MDLLRFTKDSFNGTLYFLCSVAIWFDTGDKKQYDRVQSKCDALPNLVPFYNLNRVKKIVGRYLNLYKWYQIAQGASKFIKHLTYSLVLFFPMFPFDLPENNRKPLVFWYFQGDQKGTLGRKGLINHAKCY